MCLNPLALERMFEPPSPPLEEELALPPPTAHKNTPAIPSRLSRMYVPSVDISSDSLDGLGEADMEESVVWQNEQGEHEEDRTNQDTSDYEFTFAAPGLNAPQSLLPVPGNPTTPMPFRTNPFTPSRLSLALPTDPRLKLFQFQYDTFTRDHLSAMVDSIAVNTPAGDSNTANSKESSPAVPVSPSGTSISRLRSAKRLKLSPASDFSGDGEAFIMRPHSRVDYVGESRSLMDKIRQARDFSTVSTNVSALTPLSLEMYHELASAQTYETREPVPVFAALNPESRATSSTYAVSSRKSSLQRREQAADLMAQIRDDVKNHKRLSSRDLHATPIRDGPAFDPGVDSVDSDNIRPIDYGDDTDIISDAGHEPTDSLDLYDISTDTTRDAATRSEVHDVDNDLAHSVGDLSLDSISLMEQFPPLPVALIISSSSTSSHVSVQNSAPPEGGSGGAKPTYLSPYTGGFSLAHPSTSARANMNPDDLNRFVSSSTASGVTITSGNSGTAPSIVRHEGRPIKLITPDSQMIPQRIGEMVFDQHLKKWVKASAFGKTTQSGGISVRTNGSNESEDPFRDIESLHEDDALATVEHGAAGSAPSGRNPSPDIEAARVQDVPSDTETEDVEDAEEVELTSFSFDSTPLQPRVVPLSDQPDSGLDTDSESEEDNEQRPEGTGQFVTTVAEPCSDPPANPVPPSRHEADSHQSGPPLHDTPPQRPAPRSSSKSNEPVPPSSHTSSTLTPAAIPGSTQKSTSVTPVSALKDPNRSRSQTPANKLERKRSVSFSDGRRDGPIVGVGRNAPTPDVNSSSEESGSISDIAPGEPSGAPLEPSARTKRIIGMLEDLEDTSYDTESPSKGSSGRPRSDGLQPLPRRQNNNIPSWLSNGGGARGRPRRSLSQTHSARSLRFAGGNANATFLTECSFGVAHDRLVQVITDVQPFEPHWETLPAIDLSRKELDSVARLKEFLPKLDSLNLNSNQLAWLSGIPGTIRSLSVVSNCLTAVTSFSHLLNLESLDISNNNIDSLRQLECLCHLRELRAEGNMIDNVDGLQKMDGLVKLSLQGNNIHDIDLAGYRWTRLEMLNLSHNKLNFLKGVSTQSLPALIALNLDSNNLRELEVEGGSMVRMKILRVSNNRLQQLNAGPFPNVRTLYADNNCLGPIFKAHRLTKLENLSLRNQSGRNGLSLSVQDVRDVKRLYLSGNPLKAGFISEPCYNLIYLELAACRVTSLPSDMARLTPNLRVLNLNYNFLEDVRPLQGLIRLRKLTIIGSRVKAMRDFVKILRGMLDVEMLDFRYVQTLL
ncbi:hypothetical protein BDY19DRAFT_170976 [Irpex rosettiformis]|uniref:Uncharacterized protein n=1 Tax=Irpex rosettiformis TaxID=378272 RepID=A0ACB8U2L4_9APHY|nr:hypothetical protein BDY19DRAFT_170976 [Irpex rosettiformis]